MSTIKPAVLVLSARASAGDDAVGSLSFLLSFETRFEIWLDGKEKLFWCAEIRGGVSFIWLFVPVFIFSASTIEATGYISAGRPAGALFGFAEYIAGRRSARNEKEVFPVVAALSWNFCGVLKRGALQPHRCGEPSTWGGGGGLGHYVAVRVAVVFALVCGGAVSRRTGLRLLRPATMIAVVISVGVRDPFAARLSSGQSARPDCGWIQSLFAEPVADASISQFARRKYGLEFYQSSSASSLRKRNNSDEAHVLVGCTEYSLAQVAQLVPGRRVIILKVVRRRNEKWMCIGCGKE